MEFIFTHIETLAPAYVAILATIGVLQVIRLAWK